MAPGDGLGTDPELTVEVLVDRRVALGGILLGSRVKAEVARPEWRRANVGE